MHATTHAGDPKRPDKEHRYKPIPTNPNIPTSEDLTPDYMNILGMIFSMLGLMMRFLEICSRSRTPSATGDTTTRKNLSFEDGIDDPESAQQTKTLRKLLLFSERFRDLGSHLQSSGFLFLTENNVYIFLKWCAWVALYCSSISFANYRVNDETKQIVSSFMLSISAVVMSYLQNPAPMTPPWAPY